MLINITKRKFAALASIGRVHYLRLSTVIGSLALLGLGVALSAPASAAPLIFDRGLPTANLNNAAGANRSNVAWGDNVASTVSVGDNFTLSGSSSYLIDTIRVWVVDGTSPSTPPAANAYQLWFGNDAGAATSVAQIANSSSVTVTTYSGGASYQGSSGTFRDIYHFDFSGLNLLVAAGTYAFSVSGVTESGMTTPFLHASNAALSGSTQMGPNDGIIYGFTNTGAMDVANGYPWATIGGWDKTSDINLQVFGTVPEPASLALLGLGLAALGVVRRRKA